MFQLCLKLFLFGTLIQAEPYQPGTPGAPWSAEEIAIVKSKLYSLFKSQYAGFSSWPGSAPKALRLAFHDCLRYSDGSGGCDGCLNWEGVGTKFQISELEGKNQLPNLSGTNNNGLDKIVEYLEEIYKNPMYRNKHTPSLQTSLYESGKSRADLWAFAAIVAVEFGVETNNGVCDASIDFLKLGGAAANVDTTTLHEQWLGGFIQCNEEKGEPNCKVNFPRSFKFQTGRKDCTEFGEESYIATKHEHHPNQQGNGKMTVDFMKEEFGFTGRETVAIMGAHTFGRFHVEESLYPYVWTAYGQALMNNDYYKILASEDRYYINHFTCNKVTDAEGNKPKTMWVPDHRGFTENGGPHFWIHLNYACPNCIKEPWNQNSESNTANPCCENVPEGQFCHADSVDIADDPDVRSGCEKFRFVSGLDEMALPTDVGLYLDFNVTDDGTPKGCPGGFGRFADAQCDVNKLEEPLGTKPLHQIVEEYAKDQHAWMTDFVPTMEKMMTNGYDDGDLVDSGYDYSSIKCYGASRNGQTNCIYKSEGDGDVRLVDGKYPEVSLNGTWSPICGHYFWNNNHGATLFCQKLNPEFKSGTLIRRHDKPLESDGIKIGGCFSDDHWPECTGGCNDFETGSSCFEANGGKCTAGEVSSMEIHCSIECDCDPEGTTKDFCNMETGQCICKDGFGGARCDQCSPGFYKNQYLPWFQCQPCGCSSEGSTSEICDSEDGQCSCKEKFSGRVCNQCKPNYYEYPTCFACGSTNERGQIIQTFEKWGSTFKVEFDIMANKAKTGYTNVLHLTTGEDCCGNGQRIPSVYINQHGQFVIITSLNGNGNYWFNYNFNDGQKYHFVIEQTFEDGIVMYKIVVDGEVVLSQQNNQPQNFNNVMAYVSDPWNPTFDGCMENLKFTPGNDIVSCGNQLAESCSDCPLDGCSGDCILDNEQCKNSPCVERGQGQTLETYDNWGKTFEIEFDIKVDEAAPDTWVNIFHFTEGGNCCAKGTRIPALWIQKPKHFLLCTAIDDNGNNCWTYAFDYGHKYHFEISQNSNGLFKVMIDGQLKTEIQNSQPQDYNNVKAYLSDPWHGEFHGCIENFQVSKDLKLTPGNNPEPDCQDIWSDAKCQKRKKWCAGGKKVRKYCKKTCELCG